ncbi:type II toxin-antitoxin system RelE/ParE family toxin [Rodentibacter caecimuris]|uniref:type II toxin-antitoxin system RelE/ParE family toxin n=1 Tax=Rodentibacter caecimuris TaxID=1796644 RepID=UPI002119E09C|nr:type II toxin-antitoxin system RelE/ParE family toxin [Rodentibacter heylii]MCQ9123153.1 type II toxin-antitoxin system RelE/ParE family toxin [Rodentibacter heylii]
MYTIIEHELFKRQVINIWSEEERLEFFTFLSLNPLIGDVIPQSGGMRKVRWQSSGHGKRGGARVIYFNCLENGVIEVVMIYEKKNISNIDGKKLAKYKE